jgi:hypothetical protein
MTTASPLPAKYPSKQNREGRHVADFIFLTALAVLGFVHIQSVDAGGQK